MYFLEALLPFRYAFLGTLINEVATIVFFCFSGYMFQPTPDNPYLRVPDDDGDEGGSSTGAPVTDPEIAMEDIVTGPGAAGMKRVNRHGEDNDAEA